MLRPNNGNYDFSAEFINDEEYCKQNIKMNNIIAYKHLEKDLLDLFYYIAPEEGNHNTYSLRLYELFLRACTEFENNCKGILKDNDYEKKGNDWNLTDYKKLEKPHFLSQYKVDLVGYGTIFPFINWCKKTNGEFWYNKYNHVKHNRSENFKFANLSNVVNACMGVFVILFSQFGTQAISPYVDGNKYDGGVREGITLDNSPTVIYPPTSEISEKHRQITEKKYNLTNYSFN